MQYIVFFLIVSDHSVERKVFLGYIGKVRILILILSEPELGYSYWDNLKISVFVDIDK